VDKLGEQNSKPFGCPKLIDTNMDNEPLSSQNTTKVNGSSLFGSKSAGLKKPKDKKKKMRRI
jgi:hypothetical protein